MSTETRTETNLDKLKVKIAKLLALTTSTNEQGERYHLMQLPEGYNFEAAWRAREKSAIGTMTVRFSVFTQDIDGCLEELKTAAAGSGIAIEAHRWRSVCEALSATQSTGEGKARAGSPRRD